MSILSELKKLTGKKANVISKALPDEFGSAGVFQVHYSVGTIDHSITVTESISEIATAIEAGKRVEAIDPAGQSVPLVHYGYSTNMEDGSSSLSLLFNFAEYNVISGEIVVDAFEQLSYDGHNWHHLAV